VPFALSFLYRSNFAKLQSAKTTVGLRQLYVVAATALLFVHTGMHQGDASSAAIPLVLEAALVLAAAFVLRDTVMRILGTVGFAAASICLVNAGATSWDWTTNLTFVGVAAAAALLYRLVTLKPETDSLLPVEVESAEPSVMSQVYALAGSFILAATFFQLLSSAVLPFGWGVEGIVLLAIGFRFREPFIRGAGLVLFLVLIAKLMVFDLWSAGTGIRIISTAGAGILALAGAWAFFKFSTEDEKKDEQLPVKSDNSGPTA
jgi:hypothetical protein